MRARVTKIQRRHAEAIVTEVLTAGPQRVDAPCAHYPACGGCRFQDLAYDDAARREAPLGRRLAAAARRARRLPARADRPRRLAVPLPQQDGVLVRRRRRRPDARPAQGGPLGRGARDREVLADFRPRQRDPQPDARVGAGGEAAGVQPGDARGLPPPPGRPRGPQHGPGARPARDGSWRAVRP